MITISIIKKILSPFNKSENKNNKYANYSVRYVTTIIDLLIIYLLSQLTSNLFLTVINYFINVSPSALYKYKVGIEITKEEMFGITVSIFCYYANQLLNLFFVYMYCMQFWTKFGATPVKLMTNMRVVNDDDTNSFINKRTATKRFISYGFGMIPMGLGVIYGFFDKKNQGFHDKVSGTIVVNKNELDNLKITDPFDILKGKFKSKIRAQTKRLIKKIYYS